MEKVTGKEGKGAQGTGFDGAGSSNNYSELPRSSNAAFGIDANVAAGVSDEHGEIADNDSSLKNWGVGSDITAGTVPSRRAEDIGPKGPKVGQFGVSALTGNPPATLNQDTVLGSGARKEGTAAQFGEPGRGGSMAQAIKGLSGNTGGPAIESQKIGKSGPAATLKSKMDAAQGVKGSNATD